MTIGFVGLGNIGRPMAKNLLKLGEPVYVYDVVAAAVDELVGLGARRAASIAELGRACRVVGLCVRDDKDVSELLYGAEGLLENLAADAVVAIHSTVTQASILKWAKDAARKNLHVIDAPITGGASGAAAASLCYMVGGPGEIVERCRPVFETSAQKIIHAGALGAGIALKLCNNLMTYAAFSAIHEAAALARASGLALDLLIEVGRSNGVVTPQMQAFVENRSRLSAAGTDVLVKNFGPFAELGKKDLAAALASAAQLNLRLPLTAGLVETIEDAFFDRVS